jgi:acetyl-CoA C-acetyltransferase
MFGIGPVPAVRQALERAGWSVGDVERIDINEAFAAIAIAVYRELGFAEDVVNVEGGAIAHGHPVGATGAILTTRLLHSMARDGLNDAFSDQHSGWHTEDLVERYQITRDDQDRFAQRSQQRFSAAQAAGKFDAEIAPVEVKGRKGPESFAKDEHNRPDTTMETLGKLRPAFRKEGSITAGNAPGLNSGGAAMIVADRGFAEREGLTPVARITAFGVGGVEPGMFGIGPVPAVRQALERAGWSVGDVERIEINEAFAAIAIAVYRELGFAEDVVNVEGGAIAHGHPVGATGAILTTRLLHSMKRDGLKRGVVTLCIGGGQGIALALEAVE